MTKLEIVHNKKILMTLEKLRAEEKISAFTTMKVFKGYGPLKGEYNSDFISDEQYFTIIIVDNEEIANQIVGEIKKKSAYTKFLYYTCEIKHQ